jgi:UDP-perosamine 4-acetyltransferase
VAHGGEGLLVLGGGGHGKVVADIARACGYRLVGFADADPAKLDSVVEPGGVRVVVLQDEVLTAARHGEPLPQGAGAVALAVGDNRVRLDLAKTLAQAHLPVLAHPTAVISPSARIARGTVVFPLTAVNADARIGAAVIVNTAAVVEHDCVIGDGVHISPGAVLAGGVRVGERSWIGAGATVIQGIRIGPDTVVGAGAVIIRDVPGGVTVAGNPGRILASRASQAPRA